MKKEQLYKTAYYRGECVAIEKAWPHRIPGYWMYEIRTKEGKQVVSGCQLRRFCL